MKSSFSLMFIIFLLMTSLITACGSNSSLTNTVPTSSPADATDKAQSNLLDKPVTITILNGGGNDVDAMMASYGNALKEKFPNVTFNIKGTSKELPLDKMILSGEKFDIFIRSIGFFFDEVPKNGFQYDMTNLIKSHSVDLNRIEPTLVDSMKNNSNGQMWGIPFTNSTLVLYYNKEVFDNFGIPYPKDGMTWDDIFDISKNFNKTKDGADYVGLAVSTRHMLKLNNFSMPYVDSKTNQTTFDNEKWKSVFKIFSVPAQDPGYQAFMVKKGNKLADAQDFYDGKAAMLETLVGHSGNKNFLRPEFKWDMVSSPTYKENPGIGAQSYPEYLSIPSFAEHKEEAMEIIKYLISNEFQTMLSKKGVMTVLSNKDIQKVYGEIENKGKNVGAPFFNKFAPIMSKSFFDRDVENPPVARINDIAMGKIDINTALRQAKEEADKLIAEKK
ncbi:ABC transporter substrate-binding protein [Paenibacillus ferrarius]|uniref:ABC transporter substrate-binding protein n=1 Tax=Paenibacillus ferrarius TaxID=1469647 RepID=UPI003D28EC05